MAKFYNNRVKTGRLAGSVFAVRYGETIERAYQPVVNNPRTQLQVASRAKMKLLSQLSAVMAPFIAIPRVGSVSSRNLFTKINYHTVIYGDTTASVNLNNVQLTKSVLSLPDVTITRAAGGVTAELAIGTDQINRIVYVMFVKQADGTIRAIDSRVANTPGENAHWQVSFGNQSGELVVYAYGVRDNNENATAYFANMVALSGEQVAKVIVTRVLTENDITLTETKASTLGASE